MLHQVTNNPRSALNYNPLGCYFGTTTASAFYPAAVAELWHWTGDRAQVEPFIEPALRALGWLDEYGDLDGDGFYEYKTRSEQGLKNQGWKDSSDGIIYEDGTVVPDPIATCEEQAFVYAAKFEFSEVLWWFDRKEEARRLFEQAQALKQRFNDAFWLPEKRYVAMGLDPDDRPIASVGSDPCHAMTAGILDDDLVGPVVERMFADEMFSGWGVRTLSADHPGYNPYSYHRGSVWPAEQGAFALALARYGMYEQLHRLSRAQFEAANLFNHARLPEVFSGHHRGARHPFPAFYPDANSPQAWSASSVFSHLQAMLSLYPYAPLDLLIVDPHLPDWLSDITLRGLRVGEARVTLHFFRKDGRTDYDIVDQSGPLHVVRQPSPWSLTSGFAERTRDALTSLLPGK